MAEANPSAGGEQHLKTSADLRALYTEQFLNSGIFDRVAMILADDFGYEFSDSDQLLLCTESLYDEVGGEVCSYVRNPIGRRFMIGVMARIADNNGNHWPRICIAEQFDDLDWPYNTCAWEFTDEEMLEMVLAIEELERATPQKP